MRVSRAVSAAYLAIAGASLAAAAAAQPADQPQPIAQPAPFVPRALTLGREEQPAIAALQAAAAGPDRAAQDNALAAARAAARSADARYAVARYQVEIGRARGDAAMMGQGVDALADGGLASPSELPTLIANQANRAYLAGDMGRTDRLLARLVELQPTNAEILADYGQFRSLASNRANAAADRANAVGLFQRALAAYEAAGRVAPEGWHKRALALAYDSTRPPNGTPALAPQAMFFARELVEAYPSPLNWRDALLTYRDLAGPDPALDLDIRRLLRASGALAGERDYFDFAAALDRASLPGEAKAVLDEGIAAGALDAAKPAVARLMTTATRGATAGRAGLVRLRTAALAAATGSAARTAGDAHFAHGQYAEAATLYQAALLKSGEDPNLVNSRLGASLALAGRRAEAEAALRAVAGPRADLAAFWLIWLSRRPA
jgi:tetratricopeptide (TPR) repeat protein